MTKPENSRPALQPLRSLLVEDRPDDAELGAHELRQSSFDLTWERADTEGR